MTAASADFEKLRTHFGILCVTLLLASVALAGDARAGQPEVAAARSAVRLQSSVAPAQTVYEMRIYRIKPGVMDEFVTFMGDTLIPYWERMGMRVIGQFATGDQNTYVWSGVEIDSSASTPIHREERGSADDADFIFENQIEHRRHAMSGTPPHMQNEKRPQTNSQDEFHLTLTRRPTI